MPEEKYPLPGFLGCTPEAYRTWLDKKASTHCKRDRKRGNRAAIREQYKLAIHKAVVDSGGKDEYTGQPLAWDLIGTYRNEESANGGRNYKHFLGDLPTVDHVSNGLGEPKFKICSWRVNDAKNDLELTDFLTLCRQVLDHHERKTRGMASHDLCRPKDDRVQVTSPGDTGAGSGPLDESSRDSRHPLT
jgi:hypothetical protein